MTNTDELIELVANHVRKSRFERTGRGAIYDPVLPLKETEIEDAKASLEAIDQAGLVVVPREPTAEMLVSGGNESVYNGARQAQSNAREIWNAMIQAAESSRS